MANKPVLIFQLNAYMNIGNIKHVYDTLDSQKEHGVILLPPHVSLVGAGNADGTVVIKDADGNVVLWGDDDG